MRYSFSCYILLGALLLPACTTDAPSAHVSSEAWIVFSSGRTGDGDLYALHPTTGEAVQLTTATMGEGGVRYDAARSRVIFQRFEPDSTILGTLEHDLFADPSGDVAPAWAPTGDRIVYADTHDGNLYLAASDGTDIVRLTDTEAVDRYPTWSPDGQQIAFARRLETGWDLHTIDLRTEPPKLTRRTTNGVYVGHPAWSPDGQRLAFDMFYDGQAEIAVLDLATGVLTRLTERDGNDLIPAWSPDGTRIAFGGEPAGSGNWDLWEIDVATRVLRRLTEDPAFDGGPVYVPASVLGQE